MAGTEELMARLTQLENSYNADKKANREKQFFDTYGRRFSNNRGLGLAILNELDARGIDTSAADEAVQQILDQLRTECNEILELTKEVNQAAIQTAQNVEEVSNVVSQAVASNPMADSPVDGMPAVEPAEMPPEMADAEEPNFGEGEDGTEPAPEEPNPEQGAEPTPESEPAPAESEPEPEPEQGTEPAPSDQELSDRRMKRITAFKSGWNKRSQKSAKPAVYKPSAGILSACQGGR